MSLTPPPTPIGRSRGTDLRELGSNFLYRHNSTRDGQRIIKFGGRDNHMTLDKP